MELDLVMSFLTLSVLEIVLGIDNLIFIALICDNLPAEHKKKARYAGLGLAFLMRVVMLMSLSWIMTLVEPIITVQDIALSYKDMLLLGGGIFLMYKATKEMHADIGGIEEKKAMVAKSTLTGAIMQIVFVDFVFSFDSIITAVGLTNVIPVMIAAVVVAMLVMLLASGYVSEFLHKYPTFKMLALSFILMIGVVLTAEGLHFHIPKAYIYAAFGFSMSVEILNTLASRKRKRDASSSNS